MRSTNPECFNSFGRLIFRIVVSIKRMGLSKEDPVVVALDDMETFDIDKTSKEAGSASVDERKLLRRIDFKVLPMLFIVYMAAFLDRSISDEI